MDDEQRLLGASDTAGDAITTLIEQHGLKRKKALLQEAAITLRRTDRPPTGRSKWSQPWPLYLCITATAMGAIGQGWAQTSINGANLYYPKLFRIDAFTIGIINCAIYLSNGLLGSWLVAPLNNHLGRRGAVFVGALISFIFNLAGPSVDSWQALLLCRLGLGVGLGIISSSLNVFAAECAPAAIRGGLGVAWQMFCAFGIFLGFATNMYVDTHPEQYGPLRWRMMLLAAVIPTIPLMLLIFACPESPAWYIKQSNQYNRAYDSLCYLRRTELEAAQDLLVLYAQQKRAAKATKQTSSYFKKITELVTVPRIRRATVAAYTTMLAQQLSGINIVVFYSSNIFVEANFHEYAAELASTIFGLVNFLGAFPAIWTMDSLGRRSLLLFTLPFMAMTMAIAGMSFSIENMKTRFELTAGMIYLFCLLYSPGMGPVPAAYSAEVFPLSHRELGASSSMAVTNLFAALLSLTFPWLLKVLGSQGSFLLYAVLNVVAWVLVYLFVPETKKRTLEELDEVFALSTRQTVRYRVREYPPWWAKTYILRQKAVKPEGPKTSGRYQVIGDDDDYET